jgi:hypothetical protein
MAAEVGGVKLDDKQSVGGQELVLNGGGIAPVPFSRCTSQPCTFPRRQRRSTRTREGSRGASSSICCATCPGDQLSDAVIDGLKDNNSAAKSMR